MRKILISFVLLMANIFFSSAFAVVEKDKTILNSGVRPPASGAYFRVKEPLTTVCAANVIWISFNQSGAGRAAYSAVLTAQTSKKTLSYLEYTLRSNGVCYLDQIEVAE